MINAKKFEQFARQAQQSLPKSLYHFSNSIDKKIRQILLNQFSRMNLVNREEFDIQIQILSNTQEKIKQLEERLNILEKINQINILNNDTPDTKTYQPPEHTKEKTISTIEGKSDDIKENESLI